MSWQNILEAICASPSILLEEITRSWQDFWRQEQELAIQGEFDEEEENDRSE